MDTKINACFTWQSINGMIKGVFGNEMKLGRGVCWGITQITKDKKCTER